MRSLIAWSLAAVALVVLGVGDRASAQIVIGRGPGLVVRAPYAPAIRVGARIGVPGVPLVRPYILPRRRVLAGPPVGAVAPPVAQPATAAPRNVARYAPGRTAITSQRPFLTANELAGLDDGSLLNAVLDAAARLDADVSEFNTGATWQSYLRLPDDALPPPSADGEVVLGFKSITGMLDRLNSIESNPNYAMISRLPSFAAMQLALGEVVTRFSEAAQRAASDVPATAASGSEELPTPPPSVAAPRSAVPGPQALLSR
jgi:hypothetical protein